jgi:hypothetical protein
MKKNYVYFVAPLAGLVIFSAIYWKYSGDYDARLEEMKKKDREQVEAKLNEDQKNREIAAKAAFAGQEKRKAERKAKEEKDTKDRDMRDQAMQAMKKTQKDAQKLTDQIRIRKKEVDDEKKESAKIEEEKKHLLADEAFQRDYVKKAEENVKSLMAELEKIDAADKKWEEANREAVRAAAAAAKK